MFSKENNVLFQILLILAASCQHEVRGKIFVKTGGFEILKQQSKVV